MASTSSKPTPPKPGPPQTTLETPPAGDQPPAASDADVRPAETTEPSTEGGPRSLDTPDGTAVIVDSPQPDADDTSAPRRECVVKADHHTGAAVPGSKVCSYHTMHYNNDGTRRKGI